MAHAVHDEPAVHMGMPVSNGKLAIWLFLVTEIMFFTGLIGTYLILRNGQPGTAAMPDPWPTPHDVHLIEWVGAFNTFVLIVSSLTVVLAHSALAKGNVKKAVQYIGVTLLLGLVFLVVKAFEYNSKFEHRILPGLIPEKLDGPAGPRFVRQVQEELKHIIAPAEARKVLEALDRPQMDAAKLKDLLKDSVVASSLSQKELDGKTGKDYIEAVRTQLQRLVSHSPSHSQEVVAACKALLTDLPQLSPHQINERIVGTEHVKEGPKSATS